MAVKPANIIINDDEDVVQTTRPPNNGVKTAARGMPKDYVCIILEDNDSIGPTGQTVSLNGQAYNLRPGQKVMVPPGVIEVLENAVESKPIVNSATQQIIGHRERQRFPFRITTPDGLD